MPSSAPPDHPVSSRWRWPAWLICGVILVGCLTAIGVSFRQSEERAAHRLIADIFPIYLVGCGAYFAALWLSPRHRPASHVWIVMIGVGLAMRAAVFFSPSLPGSDHCRYRWDGAMVAAGLNPYRFTPQTIIEGHVDVPAVHKLAADGRDLLNSINHPYLRTMYPPVAQILFAAGHLITPFKVSGWRLVLLAFDGMAVVALASLLARARLPAALLTVYLWNPLLPIETYFGSHLDLAAVAVVLAGMSLLCRGKTLVATAVLAVATGIKLWPVVLLPLFLAHTWRRPLRLTAAVLGFAMISALGALPYVSAFGDRTSGLLAYAGYWSANRGVFIGFESLAAMLTGDPESDPHAGIVARALAGVALLLVVLWQSRGATREPRDLCRRAGTITLVMLLLSPTLFPWYYLAVLPFAVLARGPALLAWSVLLPLSYLTMGAPADLSMVVRLAIHLPVWALLLAETRWGQQIVEVREDSACSATAASK